MSKKFQYQKSSLLLNFWFFRRVLYILAVSYSIDYSICAIFNTKKSSCYCKHSTQLIVFWLLERALYLSHYEFVCLSVILHFSTFKLFSLLNWLYGKKKIKYVTKLIQELDNCAIDNCTSQTKLIWDTGILKIPQFQVDCYPAFSGPTSRDCLKMFCNFKNILDHAILYLTSPFCY